MRFPLVLMAVLCSNVASAASSIPLEQGLVVNVDGTYESASAFNVRTQAMPNGKTRIRFDAKKAEKGMRSSSYVVIRDTNGLSVVVGVENGKSSAYGSSGPANSYYRIYSSQLNANCIALNEKGRPSTLSNCSAVTLKRCQALRSANNAFAKAVGTKDEQARCKAASATLANALDAVDRATEEEFREIGAMINAAPEGLSVALNNLEGARKAVDWSEMSQMQADCSIVESIASQRGRVRNGGKPPGPSAGSAKANN